MAGEQAGLQAQQAQGVIGMHALARTAALQPVPAVGIEPGWQVNRQHRCRCGMQGIDTGLQGGGRRATGPDAEQRIMANFGLSLLATIDRDYEGALKYLELVQAIEAESVFDYRERAEALMLGAGEINACVLRALHKASQLE